MRLTLLREIPEDATLAAQWNALALGEDQPQVFYTFEWALAVQRAYQKALLPLIFVAYEGEVACGVAALAENSAKRDVSFLCATTGDYCDFLAPRARKGEFALAVLSELKRQGFFRITLTNLPADSLTVSSLRKSSTRSGYHSFARTAYDCAQVFLQKIERNGGKVVLPHERKLKRSFNVLGRDNPVQFEHARSWLEIEALLPEFIHTHVARFLATGRISNLARPERCAFLRELGQLMSEQGWMMLSQLKSGENSIAWNYGFRFEGSWFWYQPTFDNALAKYSPGFCLLSKIVEEAAETSALRVVDLGLGAEGYKDAFANETRETLYITLRASVTQHGREMLRYRVARALKKYPTMEKIARSAVGKLQRIKADVKARGLFSTSWKMLRRLSAFLFSDTEVIFLEWSNGDLQPSAEKLLPLDLNALATAVSQHYDDEATCTYLIRCATRLRNAGANGFGMVDAQGQFVHFGWVTEFDDFFLSELNAKVKAPGKNCVMIFDCWTPSAARGHGYYARAVSAIAKIVRGQGQNPWIFSAAENRASLHGLAKSGFQRRYSLVRRRIFGMQTIREKDPQIAAAVREEASVRVGAARN